MNRLALAILVLLATGCSIGPRPGGYFEDDGPMAGAPDIAAIPDAVPKAEPRSRFGNNPYTVNGHSYTPLVEANGYRERGIASWYGKKFHGKRTSNGESYDMYAMSAAHKTLPLPSYVRVRNLQNGRSVVVRVNDRGPFLHNRLIDLSYAAASKLGIVGTGTGLVEVETLLPGAPTPVLVAGTTETYALVTPLNRPAVDAVPATDTATPPAVTTAAPVDESTAPKLFLQVGAFALWDNAVQLRTRLERAAFRPIFIQSALTEGEQRLYRVRIGPLASVTDADTLTKQLTAHGISDPIAVVE